LQGQIWRGREREGKEVGSSRTKAAANSPITLMSMSFFTFSVGYSWATKFSTMPAAVTQDYG
jgi:hypothetical protein